MSARVLVSSVLKMASQNVLQRLQQRAEAAEALLSTLKKQLNVIRSSTQANGLIDTRACAAEEARLRDENEALRQEVAAMKERLNLAEVMNGIKQVSVPISATTAVKVDAPAKSNAAETNTVVQNDTGNQPAEKNNKKSQPQKQPKKEAKEKKGDSKPKEPPAAAEVDVSRLLFKVGRIIDVSKHPDADGLYVEQVELGEASPRTIVSGLVRDVPIEEMQNRLAIFCCNLKPAKMRGILSQGMIMCASTAEKAEIINVPEGSVPGDRITFDDYPGTPDEQLNPKKKIWEKVKPDLQTNSDRVATYKGCPFKIEGKGFCIAPTAANSAIQ